MNRTPNEPRDNHILIDVASRNMLETSKVHSNLGQEIIMTTKDKIRLCLIEHISLMEKKKGWIAPLGILLTIIIVIPTTNFRDFVLIKADTWQAIFYISGIISLFWLIKAIYESRISSSLDDVINKIIASDLIDKNL